MVQVSVRYSFSQRFSVPVKEAFEWATDYSPGDLALMGIEGERKVTKLSPDAFLLEETFGRDKPVRKTKLVRINPERMSFSSTHVTGPTIYSQFWYEFFPEKGGGSRLDYTGLLLYPSKKKLSAKEVARIAAKEREEDSEAWKKLARAMESELSR